MNDAFDNEAGQAFETLPFAAPALQGQAGTELEEERGRPGGRAGGKAGGRAGGGARARPGGQRGPNAGPASPTRPTPPARPAPPVAPQRPHRPGRPGRPYPRGPYWGPLYGAGPYGLMVSDPGPYDPPPPEDPWQPPQNAAARFEPVDFPAGDDGAEPQDEIPPKLGAVLAQKAAGVQFTDAGTLAAVRKAAALTGPALYIIAFRKGGKPLAYVGMTKDLQGRLRKHMLCGAVLGVPLRNYRLFVAQPTRDLQRLRAIESAINAAMLLERNRGETTNQRSELEMEVMGPGWA